MVEKGFCYKECVLSLKTYIELLKNNGRKKGERKRERERERERKRERERERKEGTIYVSHQLNYKSLAGDCLRYKSSFSDLLFIFDILNVLHVILTANRGAVIRVSEEQLCDLKDSSPMESIGTK